MSIVIDSVMEDAATESAEKQSDPPTATEKTSTAVRTKRAASSSSRKKREVKKVKPPSLSEMIDESEQKKDARETPSPPHHPPDIVVVVASTDVPARSPPPLSSPVNMDECGCTADVVLKNTNDGDSSADTVGSKADRPPPPSPNPPHVNNGNVGEQSRTLSLINEVRDYLVKDSKCLNDEVMDFVIEGILGVHKKTEEVTYINSLNLSNAIRKDVEGRYDVPLATREDRIKAFARDLGINGKGKTELVLIVLHGPITEMQKTERNRRRFSADLWGEDGSRGKIAEDPNNHWSLLCSFRHPEVDTGRKTDLVHYDSLAGYNRFKCDEALRILQKYEVLPESDTYYVPDFMPIQSDVWECGYYPLLFTAILLNDDTRDGGRGIRPIEKTTLEKYGNFIKTLTDPKGEFRNYLREHVLRTRMNRFLLEDE